MGATRGYTMNYHVVAPLAVSMSLAEAVAQQLIRGWGAHMPPDGCGCEIIIHIQPGHEQAKIRWPPLIEKVPAD